MDIEDELTELNKNFEKFNSIALDDINDYDLHLHP